MIPPALVLLAWPLAGLALIAWLGPVRGVTVALLTGLLVLPGGYGFDVPLMPPIAKYEILSLSVITSFALLHPKRFAAARIGRGVDLLLVPIALSAFATAYTNRDTLPLGGQPLTLYDGLSMAIRDLLYLGIPFMLGRVAHREPADLEKLLAAWLAVMLGASIFVALEIRLTPFLHEVVYGYRQRGLAQEFRWGGARPLLMMPNGLALSMLLALGVVSAAVLARVSTSSALARKLAGTAYLLALLLLSRSLASAVYGLFGSAVAWLVPVRRQLLAALVLASLGLAYPAARSFGFATGRTVVDLASRVSVERAKSFEFRLLNEDAMIEFAAARPLFGYGVFGNRNRFFNQATRRRVITDGYWTILLTGRGAAGVVTTFGVLQLAAIRAWRRGNRLPLAKDRAVVAGVALMLGIQVVDLLPNGLFSFMPFYVAGALWGGLSRTAQVAPQEAPRTVEAAPAAPRRRSLASLVGGRHERR